MIAWVIAWRRAVPRAEGGFTLIEMIVVLVVLGLVMGLVLARGPMRSHTLETRAATNEVVEGLRLARAQAIAANRPVRFALDLAGRRFSIDGAAPRALPGGLDLSLLTVAGDRLGAQAGAITFAPDGSSTGGRIELADGRRRVRIGVDWLTGRVSVRDAP